MENCVSVSERQHTETSRAESVPTKYPKKSKKKNSAGKAEGAREAEYITTPESANNPQSGVIRQYRSSFEGLTCSDAAAFASVPGWEYENLALTSAGDSTERPVRPKTFLKNT